MTDGATIPMQKVIAAALLAVSMVVAGPPLADEAEKLDTGVAAWFRGDYAAALRSFRPLAEQGHAAAQGKPIEQPWAIMSIGTRTWASGL